ncbi:ribosomal protein S18 acetylase RimI-like enzyme [Mesorhizobium soli]|uniref:GNAT family N-acetyltransferase n=1 Tax=Pseudaminobacter soli (ex Li et al. 2025) TaxID=1295366 RepID=UPI0024768901|nr:GNAT family N-acetyltransferase [Mesorhizobium soli]MDH6234315.1 ribosomal protein S18 acetylase RimI-like enzyme [Mesorhizobium soli]
MLEPSAQPHDEVIRLRRDLGGALQAPAWPAGFVLRTLSSAPDAASLHALLTEVFPERRDETFDAWWQELSTDAEFDPALCFLVFDAEGGLAATAQCWTSAYLKDLAVKPDARRLGLGEALLWQVFAAFHARGAAHVDLKTHTLENRDAVRLYERLGMRRVPLE